MQRAAGLPLKDAPKEQPPKKKRTQARALRTAVRLAEAAALPASTKASSVQPPS
jgi:hypothetical protein